MHNAHSRVMALRFENHAVKSEWGRSKKAVIRYSIRTPFARSSYAHRRSDKSIALTHLTFGVLSDGTASLSRPQCGPL